jgi:hypothetical protein
MIVGKVISQESKARPNHLEFSFQLIKGYEPRVGDYVRIRSSGTKSRFLIGQIVLAHAGNMYLDNPRMVSMYLEAEGQTPHGFGLYDLDNWESGVARIIGTINEDGGSLEFSGYSPKPGDEVELLDPAQVSKALGIPDTGIFLGTGSTSRGDYEVRLPAAETVSHNMLICGRIGSGKTYAGGVIIEELLEQGIPVVAIDPHGELGSLAEPNVEKDQVAQLKQMGIEAKGYATRRLSPPAFARGDVRPFAVPLGRLTNDEIINIVDERQELGGVQKMILAKVRDRLFKEKGPAYTAESLMKAVEAWPSEHKGDKDRDSALRLQYRLQKLDRLEIFQQKHAIDPIDLVKEGTATIITLPGVDDSTQRAVVAVIARSLLKARMQDRIPRFLLYVDEGHMFAPADGNVSSKGPLIRFAKECRKFGAGLCLVSQQPADITDNIRSQCHARIFLQVDSQADMNYIRSSITDHWKDLVEMIPFFPSGRAVLRSKAFRFPLLIQIRPRRSRHKVLGEEMSAYSDSSTDVDDDGWTLPEDNGGVKQGGKSDVTTTLAQFEDRK